MKNTIGCIIGLVFVVSALAEPLLEGRVRLDSGEPVADAQVRLFDLSDLRQGAIARAQTDGTGYFALPLAALTGRALPESFTLGQNYPNPFNPSTLIPYQLAASSQVRLEVFNLLGQRIATLVDGERSAGFHTATWHATDAAGRAVGAGVYIYRMTVEAESQTGRMVLIDGQAGVSAGGAASVMPGASGDGGSNGEGAQAYGLIVSGSGLVPYADPAFRVEAGMAPVELVVSEGQHSAGKATDDDCAFCDLFGTFNDQQEEEEDDETPEEEAETDSTSSEGGPDLIVQSPSVSAVMLTPGQEFTLNATVHNQGDGQAAATTLHYYRSNNATITSSDTEVGTDEIGTLDASATSAKSIALTAPTSVSAEVGIYYGACVASVRGESNTDNNCSPAVEITVSGQEATEESDETPEDEDDGAEEESSETEEGDMIVSASVNDNILTTGQAFILRARVQNQGTDEFQDLVLSYYRSSDATISTQDMLLGTDEVGSLAASSTSGDESVSLTASSTSGTYYYGACVARVNDEGDTLNYCSTGVRVIVADEEDQVAIPDANLQAAIAAALGKASDTTITKGEMSALTGGLEAEDAGISDLTGLEFATNLTWLSLGGNNISDLSPIAGLNNLTQLALEGNNISDLSPIAGLTKLTDLGLGGNNISDLSPLAGLTNLTQLTLGLNNISDLSALRGLTNLTWLTLGNNNISDVSSLSGLTRLTYLWLSRNNISDLSALRGLTNLTELNLNNNPLSASSINDHIPALQDRGITVTFDPTPVTIPDDPTPVNIPDANLRAAIVAELGKARGATITKGEMETLGDLEVREAGISNLTGLEFATNLAWLNLDGNNISDLSPIAGLNNLTGLGLGGNNISDLSPIAGLNNLIWLWLGGNNISDLSALAGLTNLRILNLDGNNISDLSPIAGLNNLKDLELGDNNISDLSALAGLNNLIFLTLFDNNISDLSALAGLNNLIWLGLGNNNISDLSALAGLNNLTRLGLGNNNISDLSALAGLNNLTLGLRLNPLSVSSVNDYIPALERSGATVIFDPPFRESDFDIELVFLDDRLTEKQKQMIRHAARRWMSIIREDLPDYEVPQGWSGECGDQSYAISDGEWIDDLRIYVVGRDLSRYGAAGLGHAEARRRTNLPFLGCVQFNTNPGNFGRRSVSSTSLLHTAMHEIGHALGIGTIWFDDFLQDWSGDIHFNGPRAIAAFDEAGGRSYTGAKVPVATDQNHWRNSVLGGELMNQGGGGALSAITIQALADLGYSIDVTQADRYTLPSAAAKASAKIAASSTHAQPEWSCGIGQQQEPIYVVDEQRNIIRTISP